MGNHHLDGAYHFFIAEKCYIEAIWTKRPLRFDPIPIPDVLNSMLMAARVEQLLAASASLVEEDRGGALQHALEMELGIEMNDRFGLAGNAQIPWMVGNMMHPLWPQLQNHLPLANRAKRCSPLGSIEIGEIPQTAIDDRPL
jgi:hypothetical protein